MKKIRILLTGGGTGGHIYPLIAVAQTLKKITKDEADLYYFGPEHSLNKEFEKLNVKIFKLVSSKIRRYFDFRNFLDIPKFFWSLAQALSRLYALMPDVVFSKGGPGSFPVVLAARFYFIPVIIHDSDSVPGLANRLSASFAARIGISFKGAASFFPAKKVIFVGNPIRLELLSEQIKINEAKEALRFKPQEPLILVLGGSQGAQRLNNFIFENLGAFLEVAQVYHQTGNRNVSESEENVSLALKNVPESLRARYKIIGELDATGMKNALNAADLVLSRAGAGAIFEIAAFGKPSILIPLDGSANEHQKSNAYEYAENARLSDGQSAAVVIEETNFKINIVLVQIKKILEDKILAQKMSEAAKKFAKLDAAEILAKEILALAGKK